MIRIDSTFICSILGLLISCSEKEQVVDLPPVADFKFTDDINKFSLDGSISRDPEGRTLTYTWTSTSDKVKIANTTSSNTYFDIPEGSINFDINIVLTVSDGKNITVTNKTIAVPPLTQIRTYGLGKNLLKEVSNNLSYDWYLDQANTGSSSLLNCGPTSVTMGIKWNLANFTGTPEMARNTYPEGGGWWYTNDIINYLNKFSIPNNVVALQDMNVLTDEIDRGNIVILCLDMYYVEYQTIQQYHFSKFYETQGTGWGHFIVAKGYKIVDNQVFLEMYDPYSFNRRYVDNSLMGKDRYYKTNDIDKATNVWWDYAIVISRGTSTGGRFSVNPGEIVHMPGR